MAAQLFCALKIILNFELLGVFRVMILHPSGIFCKNWYVYLDIGKPSLDGERLLLVPVRVGVVPPPDEPVLEEPLDFRGEEPLGRPFLLPEHPPAKRRPL